MPPPCTSLHIRINLHSHSYRPSNLVSHTSPLTPPPTPTTHPYIPHHNTPITVVPPPPPPTPSPPHPIPNFPALSTWPQLPQPEYYFSLHPSPPPLRPRSLFPLPQHSLHSHPPQSHPPSLLCPLLVPPPVTSLHIHTAPPHPLNPSYMPATSPLPPHSIDLRLIRSHIPHTPLPHTLRHTSPRPPLPSAPPVNPTPSCKHLFLATPPHPPPHPPYPYLSRIIPILTLPSTLIPLPTPLDSPYPPVLSLILPSPDQPIHPPVSPYGYLFLPPLFCLDPTHPPTPHTFC
ncbi:TPA: hypothetical protein ACH3X1_012382 [Trebouxia sp. C0004]